MKRCEVCEKGALRKKKVENYKYPTPMGIVTVDGTSEFEECSHCKEVFISGETITYWNRLILGRLVAKKGYLSPQELIFVFSVLPYFQTELASATGREKSTLTKYKKGANPIDPLFDHTLREIISDYLKGRADTIGSLTARHQFVFNEDEPIRKISAS